MRRAVQRNHLRVTKLGAENIECELRKFHGEEYSTHRGSSYNSYLINDEKTALIDKVWGKFSGESDHSGSLP